MANLFIPSKIKVGFQKRSDTFTGKLAYVIYFDEKGKLRKETSWEGWRDKKIDAVEFENKPNSGYIFNKGVQRGGYDWGTGRSSIRVYDPRDFEFEINVDNLMGILMHSDVSKRDIVEECVFAWDGKELVLLPVNSEEYQDSVKYTQKQSEKLSAKELVKGYTYNQKKSEGTLIYVGHFEWFDWVYEDKHSHNSTYNHKMVGKKHVFYDEETKSFVTPGMGTFSSVNSEEIVENYASIVDDFFKTENSQAIVAMKTVPLPKIEQTNYGRLYKIDGNTVCTAHISFYDHNRNEEPFSYVDYHNSRYYNFKFTNKAVQRSTVERNTNAYQSHWNRNRTIGPIEKALMAKAVELGFDTKKMNLNNIYKTFMAENFGKLVFELENGNTCDANNIY